MNIFKSAALKLTGWYLALIMLVSITCSLALYNVSSNDIENNVRHRLPLSVNQLLSPNDLQSLENLRDRQLTTDRSHLKENLVFFNILVLILGGAAAYALARRTLAPIEDSLEAQKRFTSDASHELRTPLTAMQAETEVALRDPKLTKAQATELLQSNLEEVAKLKALSDGLLHLAQTNKPTELGPTDLKTSLTSATERLEKTAKTKKITIDNQAKDLTLKAEFHSLTELLVILIDNAIKYSPPGKKVLISTSSNNKTGKISIKDEGVGIKASDLPHIFDRFYRAESSRSKIQSDGYGLGLADSMDGVIEVKSAPDKGSSFTIVLPTA
jgi:two-component system, OmpR family, sensor histidine kinase CiaH